MAEVNKSLSYNGKTQPAVVGNTCVASTNKKLDAKSTDKDLYSNFSILVMFSNRNLFRYLSLYFSHSIFWNSPLVQGSLTTGGIYLCYMLSSLVQEGIYATGNKEINDTFRFPIFLVFAMCLGSALSAFMLLLVGGESLTSLSHILFQHSKDHTYDMEGKLHHELSTIALEKAIEGDQELKADLLAKKKQEIVESFSKKHHRTSLLSNNVHHYVYLRHTVNPAIIRNFCLISLTYITSMLSSNYALTQVNYPTQVLVKCAKMVPVVIGGLLLFKKTYPWYEYLSVALVTASLIVFNLGSGKTKTEATHTLFGVLLCFLSLLCDGLTGPRQDHMNSKFVLSGMQHMFFTNFFACIPSFVFMFSVEKFSPFEYLIRYPETIQLIASFCICNTFGQIFIFRALTQMGALHLSLITTTRKFFSVLVSILYFGHSLKSLQWVAVGVMFIALLSHSVLAQKDKQNKKKALSKKKEEQKHHHHHHHHHHHNNQNEYQQQDDIQDIGTPISKRFGKR